MFLRKGSDQEREGAPERAKRNSGKSQVQMH